MKLGRDAWRERSRVALMVAAIAAGVAGVGTLLGAFTILTREITRSYAGTRPASATLKLAGPVDAALVDEARRRPGIADAEARATRLARVRIGDEWRPLLVFVIDDFGDLRVSTFVPAGGAWPPPEGALLLERSAVAMMRTGLGQPLTVRLPDGAPRELTVAGLVHDPGLAPAWQERTGYAYVTRGTLGVLGEPPVLDELRVVVAGEPRSAAVVDARARELASWLAERGHAVREVRVPPPGRHPHQGQMTAVLALFIAFSAMALLLGAVLVASVTAALLARQVREIAVMKTLGARGGQIAGMYAVFIALLGAAAVVVAVPAGLLGARAFAARIGVLLNFELASHAVPWWALAVQAAAGVLVPLAVAAVPIRRASRVTVRQALDDHGLPAAGFGARRLDRWLGRLGGLDAKWRLALRNAVRRRGRLILTTALLAAAGAMFITALGVARGWGRSLDAVARTRHYDVEIRLAGDVPAAALAERVRAVPGVARVEAWGWRRTAVARAGAVDVLRTYPDGGHGSFTLLAPPPATTMVTLPLISGRWLAPDDDGAVVLSHMALGQVPDARVGGRVALSVDGRPVTFTVVGIVQELGSPAVAYVTPETLARATGRAGEAGVVRVAVTADTPEARRAVIGAVEAALDDAGAGVQMVLPLALLRGAVGDHMKVLVRSLLAMAALLGLVGALGLASATSMNVLERARELGIMKTVGASPGALVQVLVGEGLVAAALSWGAAIVLALPLTALVGGIVGRMAFRLPLPLVLPPSAVALWLGLVLVVAIAATAAPAWRGARQTIREALGRP